MTVRPTMTYLIAYVRDLIQDPAGPNQQFTDDQIQDRLDQHRLDVYLESLTEADTLAVGGKIEWHDFFSRKGCWETDVLIQRLNGVIVVPDTSEPLIGKFHFDTAQTQIPLVATGRVYDTYLVASKLLYNWVADLRRKIQSWTADGTTVQRVSQIKDLNNLAAKYASMGWPRQNRLVRRDLRN